MDLKLSYVKAANYLTTGIAVASTIGYAICKHHIFLKVALGASAVGALTGIGMTTFTIAVLAVMTFGAMKGEKACEKDLKPLLKTTAHFALNALISSIAFGYLVGPGALASFIWNLRI